MKIYSNTNYYRQLSHTDLGVNSQFDQVEATISHLFRYSHPALNNLSYGAAFCKQLIECGLLKSSHKTIVEVGAGLGHFAQAFLSQLQQTGWRPRYLILDLSRSLQQAQRQLLKDFSVEFMLADAQQLPFGTDEIEGLIISNEVIADFDAIELTQDEWEQSDDPLVALLRTHSSIIDDKILLNVGAIKFVQEIARLLSTGGCAVLTEHGFEGNARLARTGRLDDESKSHLEYSINFEHLCIVARAAGLLAQVVPLIDFLPFDREIEVANLNDAQALHSVDPAWPIAAIPAMEIFDKYGCEVRQLAGLRLPKVGGEGFPDDNTLPFAESFKVLILQKVIKPAQSRPMVEATGLM